MVMDDILIQDLERDGNSEPELDQTKLFPPDQKHSIVVVINSQSSNSTTDFEDHLDEEKEGSPLSETVLRAKHGCSSVFSTGNPH